MPDQGARKTGTGNHLSHSHLLRQGSRLHFPAAPTARRPLPRGLRFRGRPAGGATATPPPPRRNLRGPGAACFLFVGREDMAAAPASAGSGADRGRRAAATVAAWGGWGGRPRPANILLQLRQGQLTGRGLVRAVQVRSRPGGAGRGGPGGSWRGAGEEAFPGRRSVGPTPLGRPLGVPVGCTDAVSRGGAVGSGRLEAPG